MAQSGTEGSCTRASRKAHIPARPPSHHNDRGARSGSFACGTLVLRASGSPWLV